MGKGYLGADEEEMIKALLQTVGVILGSLGVIGGYAWGIALAAGSHNDGLIQLAVMWPFLLVIIGFPVFIIGVGCYSLFIYFDRRNRPEIYYYNRGWKRKK